MTFDAETEFRNLPTRKEFVFLRKKTWPRFKCSSSCNVELRDMILQWRSSLRRRTLTSFFAKNFQQDEAFRHGFISTQRKLTFFSFSHDRQTKSIIVAFFRWKKNVIITIFQVLIVSLEMPRATILDIRLFQRHHGSWTNFCFNFNSSGWDPDEMDNCWASCEMFWSLLVSEQNW